MNKLLAYLQNFVPAIENFVIDLIFAIIIILVGKKVTKFVRKIIRRSLEKADAEDGVKQFVDSFVKFGMYILITVIVISRFGIEASSIIAVVGSAGLTIGLALQGSLSNFAGGVVILVMKPYLVGDYILVESGSYEGTVKAIRIFYTTLVSADGRQIMIPNGNLANNSIVNLSSQGKRQIRISVGISYQSDIKKAKNALITMIEAYDKIIHEDGVLVFVDELADSSVVLGVRAWATEDNFWEAKWYLTEKVKLCLDEEGIEIPFNQLDVRIHNN